MIRILGIVLATLFLAQARADINIEEARVEGTDDYSIELKEDQPVRVLFKDGLGSNQWQCEQSEHHIRTRIPDSIRKCGEKVQKRLPKRRVPF